MRHRLGLGVLALALAAHAGVSAQAKLQRADLQKALVPKGSVSIDKAKPMTAPESDELRVPLALKSTDNDEDLKSVRVVEGKGRIAFQGGSPVLEQKQSGTTVLSSSLARSIAETSTINADTKTGLPWMVVDVKHAPPVGVAPPAPPTVRTGRPFLLLARAVQWVPSAKRYVAELIVGLDPEEGSTPGALAEPITASLSVSCEEVTPGSVRLDRMGPEGDQRVVVSCSPRVREQGKQHVTVRIASGQLSYPFELPSHPGPYALASSATQVPGLGLSTVRLTVSQALEDGSPLIAERAVEVPLRSQTGELHPSLLTIPRGQSDVSADVRVYGLGPMSVQAGVGPRMSVPLAIERGWPTLFLLITVLGGAAGGYLAIIRLRHKKPDEARSSKGEARRLLEGSLVGLIAVGALLTTPGLAELMPDIARGSQLAWLVAAVLAGFLGVELIELLASRLVPRSPSKA